MIKLPYLEACLGCLGDCSAPKGMLGLPSHISADLTALKQQVHLSIQLL